MLIANRRKNDPKEINLNHTLCSDCKKQTKCSTCGLRICVRPNLDIVRPEYCIKLIHVDGTRILCVDCFDKELEIIRGRFKLES